MGAKINLIGLHFGKLLVIREATLEERHQKQHVSWICQCDCGKICIKTTKALRNRNVKSCGCLSHELLQQWNLTQSSVHIGDRFGKLTIIADLGLRKEKSRDKNERWSLCKCDCGKIVEAPNNLLQIGSKKSCGCLVSSGENDIEQLLISNNVKYSKQYYFSDLKDKRPLKFDFAVYDDLNQLQYLIEFDGRQHYLGPEAKWHTQGNSLEEIQYRDNLKNNYCKEHNIILKRIPYFEGHNVTYEKLISEEYNI